MDEVTIVINNLNSTITDKELCANIRGRLQLGGILTQEPNASGIARNGDILVITVGVFGTIMKDSIETIVARSLTCLSNDQVASYASFEVNCH